jgi:capsular polysaccharide biosynthesis protein
MRKPQTAELDALREAILSRHGARAPQDQKIYISRKTFNNRILTNEPELEEIALALGYVVVQPETLPFADQVDLFSRAKVIVGLSGAGLVNMVHAPPGATVVCITIKDHAIDFWPIMAEGLGHNFAFLAGQSLFPSEPVHVQTFNYRVDPALFKLVLSRY